MFGASAAIHVANLLPFMAATLTFTGAPQIACRTKTLLCANGSWTQSSLPLPRQVVSQSDFN
eukprot:1778540-Rhodomonas_salina.4